MYNTFLDAISFKFSVGNEALDSCVILVLKYHYICSYLHGTTDIYVLIKEPMYFRFLFILEVA